MHKDLDSSAATVAPRVRLNDVVVDLNELVNLRPPALISIWTLWGAFTYIMRHQLPQLT
jgi:hypothetical protein